MEKKNKNQEINKKLEYIGLNIQEIPETLKLVEELEFRPNVSIDEKKYRQYRFVSPKEIQILLSPTNRLEDIKEKYAKSAPLANYLVPVNEEDEERHETFLRMVKDVKIEDIEAIEEKQQNINKKIPFKVRYSGNYLWQIYYSEESDKYFMIVPTEDKDYSTFFYVLKKQVEKKKAGKIFVPICNVDYSKELLNKTEIQSLENYLWTFTKDWPAIYEVYDKNDKISLQIVGETEVYGKIKSQYKVKLTNKIEATKFFKLVKALFILQTELPNYYKFTTQIDKQGSLEFLYNNQLMEYDELSDWLNDEYKRLFEIEKTTSKQNREAQKTLKKLKKQAQELEVEYLSKEKQISTFLECKKTFFGKVKYFFKYSGKKVKNKTDKIEELGLDEESILDKEDEKIKKQYTLDELVQKGKNTKEVESNLKNAKMDINAIKLKNLNLVKKIENATAYINEIDSHKKSIFEFWKYSNKDEIQELTEAEEEQQVQTKSHSKIFDYEEDFDEFGTIMDQIQKKILTKEELDSIYLTTTNQIEVINKIKTESITNKELEQYLKQIKKDLQDEKDITEEDAVDIFGGLSEDTRKITKLANKSHREMPKNKYSILRVSKSLKTVEYKAALEDTINTLKKVIGKNELDQEVAAYRWLPEEENIDTNEFNVLNLDVDKEIQNALKESETGKTNLYKMNLEKGVKAIAFTNCVYFDNQNKTLPDGMDLDTRILVKILDTDINLQDKRVIRVGMLDDDKSDTAKLIIKTINLLEYGVKEIE